MSTNRGADELCGLRKVTGLWETNSLLQKYINAPVYNEMLVVNGKVKILRFYRVEATKG